MRLLHLPFAAHLFAALAVAFAVPSIGFADTAQAAIFRYADQQDVAPCLLAHTIAELG